MSESLGYTQSIATPTPIPSSEPASVNEITSHDSPYYQPSMVKPYNPDDLYRRKGSLKVYKDMMIDEQVKAAMMMKINSVLAPSFKIEPASDDAAHIEHAKFIEYCLKDGLNAFTPNKNINNFKKSMKQIMSALPFGFSVTEKVYQQFKKGKWQGKIGLRGLKTRPPHGFVFYSDEFNNITQLWQYQRGQIKKISPDDLKYFVIYSYDADGTGFGNWYGTSDLRAAYRHTWAKECLIQFRNIYSERFGMGIIVGKYPKGMHPDEQAALEQMINNIQAKTAFKIPQDVIIDLLESKTHGQESFNASIEKCDIAIARSLLIPDKIGFSNSGTGAYSQSKTHFDMFLMVCDDLQGDLEEIVNEQIIVDLIDINFSDVDTYPKMKFNPIAQDDKTKMCEAFNKAVQTGVILATEEDEEHMREQLDFPKRTNESTLLPVRPVTVDPKNPAPPDASEPVPPEANPDDNPAAETFTLKLNRKPNKYESKINFQKTEADLNTKEVGIALAISKIIGKMKNNLYAKIARENIVGNKDTAAVNKIGLDYLGDLRSEWQDALRGMFNLGKEHALDEVKTTARKGKYQKNFASVSSSTSLPPAHALQYFTDKAMYLTGTMKADILKNVQHTIYDGIQSGSTTSDVIKNLDAYFQDFNVEQLTGSGDSMNITDIPGRINTIVRTNVNDAYNQGRIAEFKDPEVKDFVPAYILSAIMDDKTTDICTECDQKIYAADNPIWDRFTPPLHFSCRTIIGAVTADEWDGQESDPPTVDPAEGFGG